LRFVRAQGYRDLFYTEDNDVDLDELINHAKLPPCPRQVRFTTSTLLFSYKSMLIKLYQISYTCHWLAVNGVQPDIPQNPSQKKIQQQTGVGAGPVTGEQQGQKAEETVEVKTKVRHVLSRELQLYYEKVTQALLSEDAVAKQAALNSLRSDPGIHQLLPYFCKFITDKVQLHCFV